MESHVSYLFQRHRKLLVSWVKEHRIYDNKYLIYELHKSCLWTSCWLSECIPKISQTESHLGDRKLAFDNLGAIYLAGMSGINLPLTLSLDCPNSGCRVQQLHAHSRLKSTLPQIFIACNLLN
jgi:hypothetical protein